MKEVNLFPPEGKIQVKSNVLSQHQNHNIYQTSFYFLGLLFFVWKQYSLDWLIVTKILFSSSFWGSWEIPYIFIGWRLEPGANQVASWDQWIISWRADRADRASIWGMWCDWDQPWQSIKLHKNDWVEWNTRQPVKLILRRKTDSEDWRLWRWLSTADYRDSSHCRLNVDVERCLQCCRAAELQRCIPFLQESCLAWPGLTVTTCFARWCNSRAPHWTPQLCQQIFL